ncbi:MAG: glutaminyl-peptide cyclotransferase [Anaerolineae bacterium]|nr:glutaminyl-peptide cyclotransferase [Anaerolineae bacterium]
MKSRLLKTLWAGNGRRYGRLLLLIGLVIAITGCDVIISEDAQGRNAQVVIAPPVTAYVKPKILEARVHDAACYTQGLLPYNGVFYESCGQYGKSALRKVDPKTGAVLKNIDIPAEYFAEGLALVGNRLIQLTWKEQVAFVYDVDTFDKVGEFKYEGEGWGLCYDGDKLYMSNGSDNLYVRDPQTFQLERTIPVKLLDEPVFQLNELECVGSSVYANIYMTDHIVKINKETGRVASFIDASQLLVDGYSQLSQQQIALLQQRNVLNGISYDADTGDFMLTGKLWPVLFVVRLDER